MNEALPASQLCEAYGRRARQRAAALAGLLAALLALLLADVLAGPSSMAPAAVVSALLAGPDGAGRAAAAIVWAIRLPAALTGGLVGVALGMAGQQMQTILDNPLASPFTLGFSAAAGFGAALAIMFGAALPLAGWLLVPASAFGATLVACLLVYAIARLRGATAEILVLGGIAVLFLFQALQSLLQYLASPEVLQQIVFWLFGSLLKATWTSAGVIAATLCLAVPLFLAESWKLTALRLGETHARSLGVDVAALRRRTFILVALVTAAAVAFVGTIGFVGLVAPHAARALVGEDQRAALPAAGMIGGAMIAGASVLSKLVGGGAVVPVGIVTAVVGVPILFAILLCRGGAAA
ncbi:iron complex transport system permease protein [Tistlia consotensis]|uniref:Iron complex transport system permease protein n=1 Tax=Tistlia consotensis USBA 355 TaxID=560819 RepID=A0A1Y6CNC4_9PROT|nr:iron ABC transporter permease [Tistlia consotensis]SMF76331.1 iron complex transport system permease protein [Tistlia consotensis USBA 355]SNS12678.1 iron complex transport system permease protein [Tistlia consotensis]